MICHWATTLDTLAENLPNQVHDRVHQDKDNIEHEESAEQSQPTEQELNINFARTINLLEHTGSHMSKELLKQYMVRMLTADEDLRIWWINNL